MTAFVPVPQRRPRSPRLVATGLGRAAARAMALAAGVVLVGCAGLPPSEAPLPGAEPSAAASGADKPFAGWSDQPLPGKPLTLYRLQPATDLPGERYQLRSEARRSASVYQRRLSPDAPQPNRVRFGWKVDLLPTDASLADRDTEDAAVRLVFGFDGDHARLPMRDRMLFELAATLTGETPPFATLMYVWDASAEPGTILSSHSTSRIRKIVIDGRDSPLGQWRLHQRDLAADFQRAFGEAPGALIRVGVMSDADNTQSRVRAAFAPVHLSVEAVPSQGGTAPRASATP